MDDHMPMEHDLELETEVLGFLRDFNQAFARRDLEAMVFMFSPDIIGFTTGADERFVGREQFRAVMKADASRDRERRKGLPGAACVAARLVNHIRRRIRHPRDR